MTNSMKVYASIMQIQRILQSLEGTVDKAYWPDALKKSQSLIRNAEYNQAQEVAEQALHMALEQTK